MQVNGFSGNHSQDSHKVTNCLMDHTDAVKKGGGGMAPGDAPAAAPKTEEQLMAEGKLSLSAWMQKTFDKGKRLLASVWGDSTRNTPESADSGKAVSENNPQIMAQLGEQRDSSHSGPQSGRQDMEGNILPAQNAAASALVQPPAQNESSYFAAVSDSDNRERNIWEKVRVKFQAASGYLTKQFSNKNTFQSGQEQPREDMRRRSHYHSGEEELDCVITDDSFLLDSYDRKGEFRQLTPKK